MHPPPPSNLTLNNCPPTHTHTLWGDGNPDCGSEPTGLFPHADSLRSPPPISAHHLRLSVGDLKAVDVTNQTVILAFPPGFTDLTLWSSPPLSLLLLPFCHASSLPHLTPPPLLQMADLYKKQQQIQNQGDKADPEDYYWRSAVISGDEEWWECQCCCKYLLLFEWK